jgi:hypothetical protein
VQATQDVLGGAGVIVLHEIDFSADGSIKLRLVEAFKEKASIIAEYFGFEQNDIGDNEWRKFHDLCFFGCFKVIHSTVKLMLSACCRMRASGMLER